MPWPKQYRTRATRTLAAWTSVRRSRRLPSSASSAAASSGGCSAKRPGRWATASRSSIPTRTARPRPSRTSRSSGRMTTSTRPCGWPSRAVVTYELEHVAAAVVEAIEPPSRSGPGTDPLVVTQDRLAERRFIEGAGVAVAPVARGPDRRGRSGRRRRARPADPAQGCDRRLRRAGTDPGHGRRRAPRRLGAARRPAGAPLLAERELDFEVELSVVVARGLDGRLRGLPDRPERHDAGILFESVAPAPVAADVAARADRDRRERLAAAMDLVGTLTAELFLLRDGSLVVNELAPRVHNSGHWTIEGAATSQFEQHIRAICGLGLGSTAALAPDRDGQPPGHRAAAAGAASRRGAALARSGRPPAPVRQARRFRTPQDGAPHGARRRRRRRARPGATRARGAQLGRRRRRRSDR